MKRLLLSFPIILLSILLLSNYKSKSTTLPLEGKYLLTKTGWEQPMYEKGKMVLSIEKEGDSTFVYHGKKENGNITIDHAWKYPLTISNDTLRHKYGVFEMRLKREGNDLKGDAGIPQGDGIIDLFFERIK